MPRLAPNMSDARVVTVDRSMSLRVRSPRRAIGGQRFQPTIEAALTHAARSAISALPGASEDVIAVREAGGPYGIPDFLALVGGTSALTVRRRAGLAPILNEIDATIIGGASPVRPFSIDSLARRTELPVWTVQRRLPDLVRRGALISSGNGIYVRHPAIQPFGRLYAVEMKVRDWRKALSQCRRYALWTDSYVLVLGQLPEKAASELLNNVRLDGGGLVVGERTLARARVRHRTVARRLLASEYFLAALSG